MMPFDLSPLAAGWMGAAIFVAAFLRGYSGFGFSALVVAASALVTNPLNFVAVVLICEMAMSLQAWRGARGQVDWRLVRLLVFGAALGLGPGLWLLLTIPEEAAKAVISGFILVMCLVLLRGWQMRGAAGTRATFATGIASGLANAPGMGGLPVAAFFAAQPMPAQVFRATLVAYFPILDLVTLPFYQAAGLITGETLKAVLLAFPLVVLGNHLGGRHFFAGDPQGFRRFAIVLLAVLAGLGLLRALL